MNKLPLTIIIPTMNRYNSLINTITSIYEADYVPDQLIIIDQSKEIIKGLEKKIKLIIKDVDLIILYQSKPSLTKARNYGYLSAKNEYIICCDDDILVERNTVGNIYDIFEKNRDIAMISAWDNNLINNKRHKLTYYLGAFFATKNILKKEGHITKSIFGNYPSFVENEIEVEWAMGYFFAIRKSLKDKWNIFWDEKLISYAYPEDLDFSIQYFNYCKMEKLKIIMNVKVRVTHLVSQEWRITGFKSTLMYVINREYLSYKHYKSNISRLLTRWANIGYFFHRVIKKDKPLDVIKAQIICDKNRKKIKNGIIPLELYNS